MANIINIALRVYGGELSGGLRPQPFVSVGDIPSGFKPTLPQLIDEQQVWMIAHAQDYTLYSTSSKRCLTKEGQPGQLLICLFLPPQKRLANGQSPLGVLEALTDTLDVVALRERKLPDSPVDSLPFKLNLDKYRLEDRPIPLPIMCGHGPASFCVESKGQLDALMRHSRYPVLSSVGYLELGFNCKSSISIIKHASQTSPEPSSVTYMNSENTRQEVQAGLTLDDDNVVVVDSSPQTPWYKRFIKNVAVIFATVLGLFVGYCAITLFNDNKSQEESSKPESVMDEIAVERPSQMSKIDDGKAMHPSKDSKTTKEEYERPKVEPSKEKEMQAKKAEMESKAKARAEAEPKREKETTTEPNNSNWKINMQQYAKSCPVQLRLGVRLSSISYASNSVTYIIDYEEVSKYDISSELRETLKDDRLMILKKYGTGLPSNINKIVIQKDKAGRTL